MKNVVIIFVLILAGPVLSHAQFRVGPTIGVNVASLQHAKSWREDIKDNDTKILPVFRLQIGATAEYDITDRLVLQSGLLLNGGGTSYRQDYEIGNTDVENRAKITVSYLDIPLTARYHLTESDNFSLSAWGGFIVGITVSGRERTTVRANGERDTDSQSLDIGSRGIDDLTGSDIRFALGAVAESDNIPLQLKVGIQQGLTDIDPSRLDYYTLRNFMFTVSATYFLDLDL